MKCIVCNNFSIIGNNVLCYNFWGKIEFLQINNTDTITALTKIFINWIALMYSDVLSTVDVILPVPMHKTKLMFRGYNQVVVLSKTLSKLCRKHFIVDGLIRTKNIKSQSLLSKVEREINVKDSFIVNSCKIKLLKDKKILIIDDDVVTTGATLSACINALSNVPLSIKCLCIAKTNI